VPATVEGVTLEGGPGSLPVAVTPALPPAPPPPATVAAPAAPTVPSTEELGGVGVAQALQIAQNYLAPSIPAAPAAPTVPTVGGPGPTEELGGVGVTQAVQIALDFYAQTAAIAAGQGGGIGGGATGPDQDWATAGLIANANDPDLLDLPGWALVDPFGDRTLAAANPPLRGGGALSSIAQHCADYGVDTLAAVANALHEGAGGGIGDQGTAYGPFQIHAEDGRLPQFVGKGANNAAVNAWAWSDNGIAYAIRSMVNGRPSAKGLTGHPAVYAIVYGFEQPLDEKGAYKIRATEYDKLVKLGSGWAQYAAPLLAGPVGGGGVDTVPITTGPAATGSVPAAPIARWQDLTSYLARDWPTAGIDLVTHGDNIASLVSLPG
jgi:hypothetical protein